MNGDQESGKTGDDQPEGTWADREATLRYRRYVGIDGGGRHSIFFKFETLPGEKSIPDDVYAVLNELKNIPNAPGHGRGQHFSGLEFKRERTHGRVWRLPNHDEGRMVADLIEARLADLPYRIERSVGPAR